MHRIDTPTAQTDKWGAGKNGWTNGDLATGVKATAFNASFCDSIQEEICNAIEKSGITLDPADNTQLWKAISKGFGEYLAIANNLSEIADAGEAAQADARKNLALGTAATLDATTSTTDNTPGRVLKVGDRGLGLTGIIASNNFDFSTYEFAAGETLFIHMLTAINYPSELSVMAGGFAYLHVTGIRDAAYDASFIIAPQTGSGGIYFCKRSTDSDGNIGWFVNKLPTSAADVGAMPVYPTALTVDLNTLGASSSAGVYCQQMDVNATPELNYPVQQSGTLLVTPSAYGCQQEYTTFASGQKFTRGLMEGFNGVDGPWQPWRPQYSENNPPPATDLSAYATSDWVRSYFVQATRFGANLSATWGAGGGTVPAGCALTGGDFNSENEYPIYAYMQYLVADTWINATGGVGAASRVSGSHYKTVPENGISSLINLRPYLRESNDPVDLPGAPHFIDDAGYDWFEAAPKLTGRVFIAVAPDTGVIVQIADSSLPDTDAFSLYPDGVSIYGLESLPPDCSIDGTWRFDSETLTAYLDAELAAGRILSENTRLRTQFATQAMLAISTLQNRVSIGRVRAGDADALAAWQNYLIDLDELTDTQLSAPDFVFPPVPRSGDYPAANA